MLTEYETTVVIRPDIGGDAVENTLDRMREVVRVGGGKLLAINHWGKKKLAYEIEKHTRGIYVHTHYLGGSSMVAELERNLRISDNVLRYLTVKMANDVSAAEREEKAYVRPQYDVDDAAVADELPDFEAADDYDSSDEDLGELVDGDDLDVAGKDEE